MRFAFKSEKKLRCQICRIFRKKAKAIAKYPRYTGNCAEVEVHEVRKEIQKLRALLKLIRGRLAGRAYRDQNGTLRLAAHALSPLRDADVSLRSLQKFMRTQKGKVLHSSCRKLKKSLTERRKQAYLDEPMMRKKLHAEIEKARGRFQELGIKKVSRTDICKGIGNSYENGIVAYRMAERLRSKENLHEWRRRVKRLRHQWSLMEEILPPRFFKSLGDLKSLSDCLGDDHDLAILEEIAATEALSLAEWKAFSVGVAIERYHLQQSAFQMGKKIYAESPGTFVQRIQQEWDWQRKQA